MSDKEIINKIKSTKSQGNGSLAKYFQKNKKDFKRLKDLTSFLSDDYSISDRFYHIKHNLSKPKKCLYCNKNLRKPITTTFCSKKCNINYQIENTNIVEKRAKTLSKNYNKKGDKEKKKIKEKRKNTIWHKYGVSNNLNIPEVRKKKKETWIKNLGVDNPMKSEKIKEKVRKTNIEKYGGPTPFHGKEQYVLREQTWIKNWGETNPSKNNEIKKKVKETYKNKTGYCHPMYNPKHVLKMRNTWIKNDGLGKHNKGYKYKIYEFESGRKIFIQGYEGSALSNFILDVYDENDIQNNISLMNSFNFEYYNKDNQTVSRIYRRYIPDFYIKRDKLFIEVKSEYYYKKDIENIYLKSKSVINKGYNFYILVSRDGKKFMKKDYEKIKIDFKKTS